MIYKIALAIVLVVVLATSSEAAQRVLKVYYFQRPPYYLKETDGNPKWFLIAISKMVFERTDIPFQFVSLPPKRILLHIKTAEYCCSVGWFKEPERNSFALFSEPIYRNLPLCIVTSKAKARSFPNSPSMEQILRSGLTVGTIDGFSYGAWADSKLWAFRPPQINIPGTQENLLSMMVRGRIDYMFMAPEEARFLLRRNRNFESNLEVIRIADAPMGNRRFIMFSKAMGKVLVRRVDTAIEEVRKTAEYGRLLPGT